MANLTNRVSEFIYRAQTRCRILAAELGGKFDPFAYQSQRSQEVLDQIYETRQFIFLLNSTTVGGMSNREISDTIDFFWDLLQLQSVLTVNYNQYQMPVAGMPVSLPGGSYATTGDLTIERQQRIAGDASLSGRIDALVAAQFQPSDVFPAGFFDNQNTTYAVVFDDDVRLHTHTNKGDLDHITTQMVTDLAALHAHYLSINNPNAVHVTTAERTAWNAKVSASQLTNALSGYSQTGHHHAISDIDDLQSVINAINSDIANMAGADGREVELQLSGTDLQWRHVGDVTWITLGNVKGDKGDKGDPFTIGARGLSGSRFNSLYDGHDDSFAYLETDTGYLYFRNPAGGTATVPAGWSSGIRFVGWDGWSPMLSLVVVSPEISVLRLADWVGGDGDKPYLDPGTTPAPVIWYVGINGYTTDIQQAVNVRGPIGNGFGPIIGATGSIAGRAAHDLEGHGFIYMRTDVSPQTIFIKNSDASGDWSTELPWQGPPGAAGAGPAAEIYNLTSPTTVKVGNLDVGSAITGLSVSRIIELMTTGSSARVFDFTFSPEFP